MADPVDQANDFAAAAADRTIAAARAAVRPDPVIGTCNACLEEDMPVLTCGGMLRCTECRAKWEKRR
ncbi:hypothetical protein SAMN05192583_0585 [Sphingomonas gellani]|uniref:Transcriptional regulator, TraR/DksA family n=1 Tax=Sphingomonas gellani TaxID=1166340 RepID=A0A1H7ZBE4_9SPHN|nr:hypothetical protein [Sphingomonas gellani]SEM54809.1 hypothetical protein SAMN05192583_0585 [Sphingomonas gellani]